MDNPNYIFVGGCGRSGTTLVQKLLTGHSRISGYEEFGFLKDFAELHSRMEYKYNLEQIDSYVQDNASLDAKFKSLIDSFLINRNQDLLSYISEKSPSNIFAFEKLMSFYPNAKFINVVRDGRDVLASHLKVKKRYKQKGRFSEINLSSICELWNNSVEKSLSLVENSNMYTVRFEKLLKNPQNELAALMDFLGLELEDQLLNPDEISNSNNSQVNDIWYTDQMLSQNFNQGNIGKWRKLHFWKKFLINVKLAQNLNELGYDISNFYTFLSRMKNNLSIYRLRGTPIHNLYLKFRLYFS